MAEFGRVVGTLVLLCLLTVYLLWLIRDAHRRGKSAVLVLIAAVCFFPFGLVAWVLFRPPLRTGNDYGVDRLHYTH